MRSSKAEGGGRILVVDDNEMNRDMLSRRLRKRGYDVELAEDGFRALEEIAAASYDLVLLDIMMPGIDGYEVLERIREDYGPGELPVVMATAKSESEDVVRALKMGANDYVTKPFDFPVVLARARTQISLRRSQAALAKAHGRMKKDLEAAARIQRTLLPAEDLDFEGFGCAWRYIPCDELAGDTLNVLPLDENRAAFYLLDVSGHGVPAALLSVALSRLLSDLSSESSILWSGEPGCGERHVAGPAQVAAELSRRFPYDEENHQYFTLVYGVLDRDRKSFTFVSAGHTPVVHLSRDSGPAFFKSTGPPIALLPPMVAPARYEQVEIALEPGDRIFLLSDGIPEAAGPGEEELGIKRVGELLASMAGRDLGESLDALLEHVWAWCEDRGPGDDVSILGLEISG